MKKFLQFISYVLVACIACVITLAWCYRPGGNGSGYDKLAEVKGIIDTCFIGETDETQLLDAASAAMVAATGDRWSYYIPASEMQAHAETMNNAYVGVGITVQEREDGQGLDIMEVTAGGPAQEAGLLAGDVIIAVDGKNVAKMGLENTKNSIRGDAGTQVSITVRRDEEELTIAVERRAIQVIVASGKLLPDGIGLVTIENFNAGACEKTVEVIEDLRTQGAAKLIFDVRFNPGGYRHELVKLLDYLLPEGLLFRSEYYTGEISEDRSDASFLDMPMAVLMNGDSYSAAEFFAAALREYDAAILVGSQTCGKGYFQQTLELYDGSALNLSTGKYFTPKGVSLAGVGLTPDVTVDLDEETYMKLYYGQIPPEEDAQLLAAVEALKKS